VIAEWCSAYVALAVLLERLASFDMLRMTMIRLAQKFLFCAEVYAADEAANKKITTKKIAASLAAWLLNFRE